MAKTAVIATLAVNLTANSAKFNQALARSRKKSQSWGKETREHVNTAGKAFAGLAVAATAAFAAIYTSSAKSIDQLAKQADKLGVTTEALAGLRHAAELTGASQQTLDMALQRMTRRLSEAAAGGGEAVAAIKELGLDAKKLAAASPDKAFSMIADAMGNVKNQSDKVRLTFKFFDSEGVALVNTLASGSQGLKEMAEEAEQLGLTLSRVDAAKVELANNATVKARALFTGFGNQLTVKFAPILAKIVKWFTKSIQKAGGMGKVVSKIMNGAAKAVGVFADGLHGIQILFKGAQVVANVMALGITTVFSAIGIGVNELKRTLIVGLIQPFKMVLQLAAKFSDTAGEWLGDLQELENSVNQGAASTEKFFTDAAEASEKHLSKSVDNFKASLLEPLPSDSIKEWVATAVEESTAAAEKIAENSPGKALATGFENAGKKMTDSLKRQFESVGNFIATDEEKTIAAFEKRETIVNEYFDALVVPNEERRNEILAGLETKKQKQLTKIKTDSMKFNEKFEAANFVGRMKMLGDFATRALSATQGTNKKAFKMAKAFSLAQAAISLPSAVIESFEKGGGFPWGLIPAGLMLAEGISNINRIKNTQYTGTSTSGGGATVSGGGSISQPTPQPTTNVQSTIPTLDEQLANQQHSNFQNAPVVNNFVINATGNDGQILGEQVRQFIEDGGEIIPIGSRQEEQILAGAA